MSRRHSACLRCDVRFYSPGFYSTGRLRALRTGMPGKGADHEMPDSRRSVRLPYIVQAVRARRVGPAPQRGRRSLEIPLALPISRPMGSFTNDRAGFIRGNEALGKNRAGALAGYRVRSALLRSVTPEAPTRAASMLPEQVFRLKILRFLAFSRRRPRVSPQGRASVCRARSARRTPSGNDRKHSVRRGLTRQGRLRCTGIGRFRKRPHCLSPATLFREFKYRRSGYA